MTCMNSASLLRSRTRFAFAARILAAVALVAPLGACSSFDSLFGEKYETKILPDVPADESYNQGLARLQKKDFEGAAKKFDDIEKQHPYSEYSKKGLIMSTYSEYEAGKYTDAVQSGQRFVARYPNSPDAAYAQYLVGMSYYHQIPDVTRDQDTADKALTAFNAVVTKYPKSEYAEDAKYKIQVTRDQLAGKEMSVGRFYLRRNNYTAAINRFREVLGKYQTTRQTEEALMRLTEAYIGLGIIHEAQTAAAVLGHNFPDSTWYKDAYSKLQGVGAEPKESQDSWISKMFRGKTGQG
jgi:outer membrane protein assembly factor BamD